MKTLIEYGDYRGSKTMSIWEVDEAGQKKGDYPIISFGKKKAQAIVENAEEIQEFAEAK